MLTHPTHERLLALGLTGMAKALEEQRRQNDLSALDFEERLALMIDRETIERENKRLAGRLKVARLRQSAVVEDINMKASAKVGSPARSVTKPAATTAPCSITACQGCSMPWRSLAATDGTHGC